MSTRLSPDEIRLRAITETQWQAQVEAIASSCGWKHWHAPDNRPVMAKSGRRYVQNVKAGFPDLVLVRGTRLVFAELKRQGPAGRLKPEQVAWLTALAATGAEVWTWRPGDLEQVKAVLR